MSSAEEQRRARTFVRGVKRITERWAQQTLSELREGTVDEPTRRALAALALDCDGLLEGHGAQWPLAALIGLNPDTQRAISSEQAQKERYAASQPVTQEEVINWIDLVCDALEDLHKPRKKPGQSRPPSQIRQPRRVVSARLPRARGAAAPKGKGEAGYLA